MKVIGYLLIVAGIFALIYTGYSFKTKEKVVDLGPLEIVQEKKHSINWPPIAGCVLLLSGVALIVVDKKGSFFK
jgi:hypothetical protein